MCGICGFVGNPTGVDHRAMLSSLIHRGPDDVGIYEEPTNVGALWLGHRRLAIIDPSPGGHQPMQSRDQDLVVSFNGEIYNHKQLRHQLEWKGYEFISRSDTEVLLAAWKEWGHSCLHRLEGMYAFALWTTQEQTLYLVRDRLGEKPLYYSAQADRLLFASELRAVLASSCVKKKLNPDGIESYLTFGSVYQPHTLADKVSSLLPGQYLIWKNQSIRLHTYWSIAAIEQGADDTDELNERVRAELQRSHERCLVSDVPIALLLSGGVDSTASLSTIQDIGEDAPRTFSVVYDEAGKEFSEEYWSTKAAETFRSNHTKVRVSATQSRDLINAALSKMDQPSHDGFNSFIVCSAIARQGLKVAISGQGADELFLGYRSRSRYPKYLKFCVISQRLQFLSRFGDWFLGRFSRLEAASGLAIRVKKLIDLFGDGDPWALAFVANYSIFNHQELRRLRAQRIQPPSRFITYPGGTEPLDVLSRLELTHYLRNTLLRDVDQMSMANSIEMRAPYVNHKLIEAVVSIPAHRRMQKGRQKPLLVDATQHPLVAEISRRPKQGFVLPIPVWAAKGSLHQSPIDADRLGLDRREVEKVTQNYQNCQETAGFAKYWTLQVLAQWAETNGMSIC